MFVKIIQFLFYKYIIPKEHLNFGLFDYIAYQ